MSVKATGNKNIPAIPIPLSSADIPAFLYEFSIIIVKQIRKRTTVTTEMLK